MLLHSAMILPLEDVCIDHAPHLREGKWAGFVLGSPANSHTYSSTAPKK